MPRSSQDDAVTDPKGRMGKVSCVNECVLSSQTFAKWLGALRYGRCCANVGEGRDVETVNPPLTCCDVLPRNRRRAGKIR